MPDTKTKQEILEKILNSSEFEHSKNHKKLLSYLVQASINGITPDENSIALDVFDKKSDFNPNEDTSVRVNVFHLRKKLEKYYQNEGKHDKIRIEIPRGHYAVKFIQNSSKTGLTRAISTRLVLFAVVLLSLIIGTLGIFRRENDKAHNNLTTQAVKISKHPLWQSFTNSPLPTMIVLGEIYFFRKYDAALNQFIITRLQVAENSEELEALQETYPSQRFEPRPKNSPSYFAMNSIWPLVHITPLFVVSNHPYYLQRSSNIPPREIKENDIIFIGYYRSLGLLQNVCQKLNIYFDMEQKNVVVKNQQENDVHVYTPTMPFKQSHKDYCVVKKLPGPEQNTILIMASFSATGTRGAARYLTHTQSLKELDELFIERYGEHPPYFEILFEVSGYERSDLDTKIKDIKIVDSKADLW